MPRDELFITTKLFQTFHRPEHVKPACERSLQLLGLDYVDLYLMHWPFAWEFQGFEFKDLRAGKDENGHFACIDIPFTVTWKAMEQLVKDGLVKSIGKRASRNGTGSICNLLLFVTGVSNFTIPMLEELLANCEIPPAVNQVCQRCLLWKIY